MSALGDLSKRLARGVLEGVARQVSRNELFEQPGERPTQPPLFVAAPSTVPGPAQDAVVATPAAAPSARRATASLTDIDGLKAALAQPGEVLVVNHWATWCIPCIEEFGHLKALQQRVAGRARFLGVSWDLFDPRGDEDDIREHVENFGTGHALGWPSLVLGEAVQAEAFFEAFGLDFHQIPQTWILRPDGAIAHRVDGVIGEDDLDGLVAAIEGAA